MPASSVESSKVVAGSSCDKDSVWSCSKIITGTDRLHRRPHCIATVPPKAGCTQRPLRSVCVNGLQHALHQHAAGATGGAEPDINACQYQHEFLPLRWRCGCLFLWCESAKQLPAPRKHPLSVPVAHDAVVTDFAQPLRQYFTAHSHPVWLDRRITFISLMEVIGQIRRTATNGPREDVREGPPELRGRAGVV